METACRLLGRINWKDAVCQDHSSNEMITNEETPKQTRHSVQRTVCYRARAQNGQTKCILPGHMSYQHNASSPETPSSSSLLILSTSSLDKYKHTEIRPPQTAISATQIARDTMSEPHRKYRTCYRRTPT